VTNIFDEHLPPLPSKEESATEERSRSNKRDVEGVGVLALRRGQIRLQELSGEAFDTLREAMRFAEYPVAVSAAKAVLDRSGFGPTSTLKIQEGDLEELSTSELAALAIKLASRLAPNHQSESNVSVETPGPTLKRVH